MDLFSILEFLNGLGFPLPLCAILAGFFRWLCKIDRRIDALEGSKPDFVRKPTLKDYVRNDICDHKNIANKLGESLNSQKIEQLDTRVDNVERQINGVKRSIMQLRDKVLKK